MNGTVTLAEVAGGSLAAVRILERYGLDYCCGGRQLFAEACAAKGLDPAAVLAEIAQAQQGEPSPIDWQSAPLDELIAHIVRTHHEYLKRELPALSRRFNQVVEVHGAREPELWNRMAAVFGDLRAELELHMHKEEQVLFPFIEQYEAAAAGGRLLPPVPFGSVTNPISVMEREHASAGEALARLRALSRGYELPAYACNSLRALYEGLRELERDLHLHIHLENNILFPRSVALEESNTGKGSPS